MDMNSGRQRHVGGSVSGPSRRGSGLGGGPVGGGPRFSSGGSRGPSRGGGGFRFRGSTIIVIIVILVALFKGGGSGVSSLLSSFLGGGASTTVPSLLGSDTTYGSSSGSSWDYGNNTSKLSTVVDSAARKKFTTIKGGGDDKITIMVYLCGTDLESRSGMASNDLQEMCNAKLSKKVNLLVYTGGCKGWRTKGISDDVNQIYKVESGGLKRLVSDDGAKKMTDPSTLSGFIRYCAKEYPANRYELILWDHGGGSVSGYGYDEKYSSSGSMDLGRLRQALEDGGIRYDFIGFDACLMATYETALMASEYADYLIASEETEPGIGWYYTDWLTALSKNTSMPTTELGKEIIDDYTSACASKVRGQQTTLSLTDLSELSQTSPSALIDFANTTSAQIQSGEYKTISNARSGSKEFATSSKIDQVDLVHLSNKIGSSEAKKLSDVLLSAVKYNRTSTNVANAYGLSIYFPYRKTSKVDSAVSTYDEIGMDQSYAQCIKSFAGLEVTGQAAAGGSGSPLTALLEGAIPSVSDIGGATSANAISSLIGTFLDGSGTIPGLDRSNTGFLDDSGTYDIDMASDYVSDNQFDPSELEWDDEDGQYMLTLSDEQWDLIQNVEENLYYDDGEGYIDLGLDNTYQFTEDGKMIADTTGAWLTIDGQVIAYNYEGTTEDEENGTTISGYVPVLINGEKGRLLLSFDDLHPSGQIVGAVYTYDDDTTDTIAKNEVSLTAGDKIDFIADYYSYDGDFIDNYMIGKQHIYTGNEQVIDMEIEGRINVSYKLTDIYQQTYYTPALDA